MLLFQSGWFQLIITIILLKFETKNPALEINMKAE